MEHILQKFTELVAVYGLNIVLAIIILVVGRWAAGVLKRLFSRVLERAKIDITVIKFLSYVAYYGMLIFVLVAALNQAGIQTTSLIAVLGAAGLAVGLALQSSLSNFAAGLLMIVFRPFQVGHFIQAGGTMGTVEEIQILTTRLKTADNLTVIVPNAKLMGDSITNYSAQETRRIELIVGVGYRDDLRKVKEVLHSIINRDSRILTEPAPFIGVHELASSSVNMVMRVWVRSADYLPVLADVNETLKTRFDEEGITIPFAQYDVHLIAAHTPA
ncbi:MAG: mechanosensitive ion channel domain-containing protein [Thermodesulfobacteriota bacterium]